MLPQGIQCTSLAGLKAILNQKLSGFETSKFKRGREKLDVGTFASVCVHFSVHVHVLYMVIYEVITAKKHVIIKISI